MEAQRFQTPCVMPREHGWGQSCAGVTLQVTASDARRIVRALEETSVRLGNSPSGSRLAGSYIRLAGSLRRQVADAPPDELDR